MAIKLVLYYTNKCRHCTDFKYNGWINFLYIIKCLQELECNTVYQKISNIQIYEIDCEKYASYTHFIMGYPTLKLYINNKEIIYRGNRTGIDVFNFLIYYMFYLQ